MSHTIYYFTGTGNSLHIANQLAMGIPDTQKKAIGSLDLTASVICNSELVGIVFPVYFLDCPDIVRTFLDRLDVVKGAYVYCVANCGAMAGNTLANVEAQMKKRGITLSAGHVLFVPDNSIVFPTPPDKISTMLSDGDKKLKVIVDSVKNQKKELGFKKSFLYGFLVSRGMKCVGIKFLKFKKFNLEVEKCTHCRICEKVCPVNNISCSSGTPAWGNSCEMCFACVHWCPSQAIKLKKQKAQTGYQYTHPKIKIEDIIKSNFK